MRIAAIYDIHGNLPALEAVLQEVRQAGVDQIVVGGDVFPGPMARETLECLQNLDLPVQFILGNGDREVLAQLNGRDPRSVPEAFRDSVCWNAGQLGPEHQQFIASWPATLRVEVGGLGEVLFCHATPRNDTEVFTRLTTEDRLIPVFAGVTAKLVICGHTHMQFDRMVGSIRVVNAGSVGMPYGQPGADWLLLGPDVQLRHTTYDLAKAAERIGKTGYPKAPDHAARYVLNPPTEREMLEIITKAELK